MTITARFNSVCPTCQTTISAGETVAWQPGAKAAHVECPSAGFIARPRQTATATIAQTSTVPNGTYTVVLQSGERRTIRLRKAQRHEGVQYVTYLSGPNNEADYTYAGKIVEGQFFMAGNLIASEHSRTSALAACITALLSADASIRAEMGLAYALASGNCFRCGRTLTVPASISRGLGPECAQRA